MDQSELTRGNDRGAVLVHVALALLALIAFTTFVVDYGVLWTARRQSQNSADAAALAAAMAYAGDTTRDKSAGGDTKQTAILIAQKNLVWGEAPSIVADDITFPACPDGQADGCVRVNVFRNTDRNNPLPMFFGPLVGITEQNIRATATAQIRAGNASECLKPWAVPDKWLEVQTPAWDATDEFNRYDKDGNVIANPDVYTPPTKTDPGTGFTIKDDYGTPLTLKFGDPQAAIRPGWFFPVIVDPECTAAEQGGGGKGTGGNCYRAAISGCAPITWGIGDFIETEPGNMVGPTDQGVKDLIDLDPDAKWDSTDKKVIDSCVDDNPPTCNYSQSPRIVPIPIFDLDVYETGKTEGRTRIKIVNILGFFVDSETSGKNGKDINGYLVTEPSLLVSGKGEVGWESAFSRVFILVR